MVDPWQKSGKRSSGKPGKKQRNYTFYLDACFDCSEVRSLLDDKGVRYVVYDQHSLDDEKVLPNVGTRIFITSDYKQIHRKREQFEIKKRKMRHFSFPANLSAEGKAKLLVKCKNNIWKKCRETEPPFSFAIDKQGRINLRMDGKGIVHGREKEKNE